MTAQRTHQSLSVDSVRGRPNVRTLRLFGHFGRYALSESVRIGRFRTFGRNGHSAPHPRPVRALLQPPLV